MTGGPAHGGKKESDTGAGATTTRRIFEVEDANRMLPYVSSIVRDVVKDFKELRKAGRARRELEVNAAGRPDAVRIEALKDEVEKFSGLIEGYLAELSDLGLEVRDLELGLVDFPTFVDGTPGYLSWRLGEERIAWWHPADKGFSDRVPIS